MYIFKIHGKAYKVRFTYRMVCKGDLLDKVSNLNLDEMDAKGIVDKLATTTAELLLAGLQKYHSDEFGYKTDEEKADRIDAMLQRINSSRLQHFSRTFKVSWRRTVFYQQ